MVDCTQWICVFVNSEFIMKIAPSDGLVKFNVNDDLQCQHLANELLL